MKRDIDRWVRQQHSPDPDEEPPGVGFVLWLFGGLFVAWVLSRLI